MDPRLQSRLKDLASRSRSQVFAWLLIGLWCCLLWGVWFPAGSSAAPGSLRSSWLGILLFAIALPLGLFLLSRFGYRDVTSVARSIERRFPEIDQKLLTAIEPAKENESGFLRNRLVKELLAHDKLYSWGEMVPTRRLRRLWGLQWFLGIASIISLFWGFQKSVGNEASGVARVASSEWIVEPGNTEIETGSDLLVSVRFPSEYSEELKLVVDDGKGGIETYAMQRSLRDPVASVALRKLRKPFQYRVESSLRGSESYSVSLFEHPSVAESDATIHYPTYANLEDKTIRNTRRITLVDGAKVDWELTLNKPVASAELIDEAGRSFPLERIPEDQNRLRFSVAPSVSGNYRLNLFDSSNRTSKTPEEFHIKVLPNKEPSLKLASPADQRVSAIQEMLVGAKVQDDFGIHRTGLRLTVGDSEEREIVLNDQGLTKEAGLKKSEVQYLIDLEAMSAKVDQLVTYNFWTEDLDRDGNPRRIDSEIFFAEIRPFEEFFREGDASATEQRQRQQQQQNSQGAQQAEDLAELEKKIMSATWNVLRTWTPNTLASDEAIAEKLAVIRESQGQALEQTSALEQQLQNPDSEDELKRIRATMQLAIEMLTPSVGDMGSTRLRDAMKEERGAYEGLLRIRAREHEVMQSQQQQQQSSSQSSQSASQRNRQQQIEQLQLEKDPSRYEEESAPKEEEKTADREMRQVMNRLDELARRQQDLNEQIRELDLALQAAKNQEEKTDLQERLDRLREDQQELVRDTDELLERMNEPETRNQLEQARQQIESAREQMQRSEQQLQNAQPSAAVNSGARAQETVDQTRQEIRAQSSQGLRREVEQLVDQAKSLERNQSELEKLLQKETVPPEAPQLGDPVDKGSSSEEAKPRESLLRNELDSTQSTASPKEIADSWRDQKGKYQDLLDRMKETIGEAESSEPLLAEQLYETYRDANRQQTDQRLSKISSMIERGLDQPALEESREVSQSLRGLREKIEQATSSVLGSEEESLRRALQGLDQANRALEEEMRGQMQDPASPASNDREERNARPGDGSQAEPDAPSTNDPRTGGVNRTAETGEKEAQQPSNDQRQAGAQTSGSLLERMDEQQRERLGRGRGRVGPSAPLTGEDYAEWSDRLREIEELVTDSELKAEAARVREAARSVRVEYKRHSKEPQWDLVKKMISDPLQELQRKVQEELIRRTAKQNELVPLDRDPVPEKYQSKLDRYYEKLGSGGSK